MRNLLFLLAVAGCSQGLPNSQDLAIPPTQDLSSSPDLATDTDLSLPSRDLSSPFDGPVCTFGQDQTCNDNIAFSSLHGHCELDGTCTCKMGKNPNTGRCL